MIACSYGVSCRSTDARRGKAVGGNFLQEELTAVASSGGPDATGPSARLDALTFLLIFLYAVVAMMFIRELVIPLYMSSIDGILPGDPSYYHQIARAQAEAIRSQGLAAFELRPEGQGPAGIASLLYLVSPAPQAIVVLNSLLHAVAGVALIKLLMNWFARRVAVLAALPFVVSPYMIVWFSQLNKDSFAAAGAMLLLAGFFGMIMALLRRDKLGGQVLVALCGVALLWVVRPYLNQILLPIIGGVVMVCTVLALRRPREHRSGSLASFICHAILLLLALSTFDSGARSDETLAKFSGFSAREYEEIVPKGTVADACIDRVDQDVWETLDFLPDYMNERLRALAAQRCMVFTILYADSNQFTQRSVVDAEVLLSGAAEAIEYIPRALMLGVLSPWPSAWFMEVEQRRSIFYTIVALEVLLLYMGLFALVCWLCISRQWSVLVPFIIVLAVLTVYGMSTPFVGALYRYRYPFWMFLVCLGAAAALDILPRGRLRRFFSRLFPVQ